MSFRSGKNGRFQYGANTFKIKRWTVQIRNQLQDTTNGESGGFGEYIAGVSDLEWSVELDYDVGTTPFASARFVQGTQATAVLYVDGVAQPNWTINAIIEGAENDLDVHGLVSIRLNGRATSISGTGWTAPTS